MGHLTGERIPLYSPQTMVVIVDPSSDVTMGVVPSGTDEVKCVDDGDPSTG